MAVKKIKSHPVFLLRPPSELSHFTSVAGLIEIVRTESIWASNVAFLNDRKELQHGIDATKKVLADFSEKKSKRLRQAIESVIEHLQSSSLPETYVSCFCKKHDLLSQWRGYSGKQQGVSITFSGIGLFNLFRKFNAIPMEVIYDKERTIKRVRNSIKSQVEEFFDSLEEDEDELIYAIEQKLPRLVPRFKDSGFQEEDEWRFVIQKVNKDCLIKFRDSDGVIVPYIEVSAGDGQQLPIKKITVGPGRDQELKIKSIKLFLKNLGHESIPVNASEIPYRT